MFSKVDYIKVNVSDMSRSVAFYRDIPGGRRGAPRGRLAEWRTGVVQEPGTALGGFCASFCAIGPRRW
jgi:hypothetical protein